MASNSVSSIEYAFTETELLSEAETLLGSEIECCGMVISVGGDVDVDETPFLAEDDGGEG